jgi:hypothetical protein
MVLYKMYDVVVTASTFQTPVFQKFVVDPVNSTPQVSRSLPPLQSLQWPNE